jgi:SAM-dependent methyltransferase
VAADALAADVAADALAADVAADALVADALAADALAADMAPDGSPVEVFDHLPAEPAAGYVLRAIQPGADVLELGCGAGRLTRVLLAAGHHVVAVDQSPTMLARVPPAAERVLGDAATLDLGRCFGAVLLGSYLVNHAALGGRFLATAAHHLAPGGTVVIQRYDPAWVRSATTGAAVVGPVTVRVTRLVPGAGSFKATVAYKIGGRRWEQVIEAAILDDSDLDALAAGVGLVRGSWLDEHHTWATLTPSALEADGTRPSERDARA